MNLELDVTENPVGYAEGELVPEKLEELAAEKGCTVLPSVRDVLQIDLDGEEALNRFRKLLDIYQRKYEEAPLLFPRFESVEILPSKTQGHHHVLIRLGEEMGMRDRILWQALLGSDPTRELLSLCRMIQGYAMPLRLFRPKENS